MSTCAKFSSKQEKAANDALGEYSEGYADGLAEMILYPDEVEGRWYKYHRVGALYR